LLRSWGISTTCEQPLALAPTPLIQVGVAIIVALVVLWMLCHRDNPPKDVIDGQRRRACL
jgi:hypothetical protein